jgi:hypothetical protein
MRIAILVVFPLVKLDGLGETTIRGSQGCRRGAETAWGHGILLIYQATGS